MRIGATILGAFTGPPRRMMEIRNTPTAPIPVQMMYAVAKRIFRMSLPATTG
jgi:hypothetical protein